MAQAVSRRERREVTQWVMLFRLLLSLIPSSAARRAGAVVFAGIPDSDLGTASRKKAKAKQAPEMLVRKIRRELMLSQFLSANPGRTAVSIYWDKSVRVHRSDWYRWKSGEMPESSDMARRIEKFISLENSVHSVHCVPYMGGADPEVTGESSDGRPTIDY